MSPDVSAMTGAAGGIAVVMPRNMRFSARNATSIDLYVHEIARASRHAAEMTVYAEHTESPFADVRTRFWEPGAGMGARTRLIAQNGPRLVVVHQHLPTAVELARKLRGIPVAVVRHNFVKPPRSPLMAFWRRRRFRRLAAIAFVSECCRDAFHADWPGLGAPLFVTPNGIDTAAWRPAAKRRRVVFTGRLAPEKGVLEAVRALGAVLPRHPDWDAVLVLATTPQADGYAGAVRAEIAALGNRITVLENIPHAEVGPMLAEAAIALAPTQNAEPFGRVAVEALATGAALVATRRGGFVEVVGDAGVLVEPPSAEVLAQAMEGLITDPARRAQLAALGPARVAGRYDLASAAAAFDRMVDELLPGASNGRPAARDGQGRPRDTAPEVQQQPGEQRS